MRLIDAELMIANGFKDKTIEVRTEDIIETHETVVKLLFRDAVDFINKQPTVDAVPVVRCKECRHFKTINLFGNVEFCDRAGEEIERWLMVGAEDFCSKGERRY